MDLFHSFGSNQSSGEEMIRKQSKMNTDASTWPSKRRFPICFVVPGCCEWHRVGFLPNIRRNQARSTETWSFHFYFDHPTASLRPSTCSRKKGRSVCRLSPLSLRLSPLGPCPRFFWYLWRWNINRLYPDEYFSVIYYYLCLVVGHLWAHKWAQENLSTESQQCLWSERRSGMRRDIPRVPFSV